MKISNIVLDALAGCRMEGPALYLEGQLDRATYLAVNKVLEAAGGKWDRKAKAHLFAGDATDVIDPIVLTGEIATLDKNPLDFFPTPKAVVNQMVALARIEPGMVVLEPSAGSGAIVETLLDVGAAVDAVELDGRHLVQLGNLKLSLADRAMLSIHTGVDFLTLVPAQLGQVGKGGYDRVVMNPPFRRQSDIAHVLHALKFLKPGGVLVSVMSAAVTFRTNKYTVDFRELVEDHGVILPLPEGSFKESGTGVNTVLVRITA